MPVVPFVNEKSHCDLERILRTVGLTTMPTDCNAATCFDESIWMDWYNALREEVDFQCSFCNGVHTQVAELEKKVRDAYASTASGMRQIFDTVEIASKWYGMYVFATELLTMAEIQRDAHQICGVDTSGIQKYQMAALERFNIHCPIQIPA